MPLVLPASGGGESLLTAIYILHSPKRVDVHFDTSSIRYSINITLSLTVIGIHKTQGVALGYVHVGLAGLHYDFKLLMSVVQIFILPHPFESLRGCRVWRNQLFYPEAYYAAHVLYRGT